MSNDRNIASFVLRFTQELWEDAQQEPHVRWRGHIRHVQGEEENRFTDFAEAASFMQRHLTQLTIDSLSKKREGLSQEKMMQESFKLWEQFASSYTNVMFNAMEQGIKQSKAFRDQIDETRDKIFRAWQFPLNNNSDFDDDYLNKKVSELQNQVNQLADRVKALEKKLSEMEQS
ncbi:MAG: hypothetical protein H6631_10650 [Anaerolineaceae bacterium]|nr:hypothetical protein [Anaerolineaceae bacterium]MCB9100876.1 hypothetical protein [Anaerolineales bacterium]